MRTLSSTQIAAQAGPAALPLATLTLRPAAAYDDRYQFPAPGPWSIPGIAMGNAPIAAACRGGTLYTYALVLGNIRQTPFSGATPPVQGATTIVAASSDTRIAAAGDGSRIAVATAHPEAASTTVSVRIDSGSGFAGPEAVVFPGVPDRIALAWSGDGRLLVVAISVAGAAISVRLRASGGGYAAVVSLALPGIASASGIAVCYSTATGGPGAGDFICIYSGGYGTGGAATSRLAASLFGDGAAQTAGVFSAEQISSSVATSDGVSSTGTMLTVGGVTLADSVRWTLQEDFQNPVAGYETVQLFLQSAIDAVQIKGGYVREPLALPLAAVSVPLPVVDRGSGRCWLVNNSQLTYRDAPASTDLAARVLRLQVEEDESSARCGVLLDNSDGALTPLLTQDLIGQRLGVAFGYRTSAGAEFSTPRPYWVSGAFAVAHEGARVIELQGADAWHILAAFRPRRPQSWTAGAATIAQLLQWVLARCGLPFTAPGSPSTLLQAQPAYLWHNTATAAHAVHDLLDMVPEVLSFNAAGGYLRLPLAGDAAVYAYTPAAHPVLSSRRSLSAQTLNHVQVFGSNSAGAIAPTLIADAYDAADAARIADVTHTILDRGLALANAQARADATLRKAQLLVDAGEIATAPNLGLELWDPIAITDPGQGWNAALFRARAIHTHLDWLATGGIFTQSVGLMNA